jgi:hypothetical protein
MRAGTGRRWRVCSLLVVHIVDPCRWSTLAVSLTPIRDVRMSAIFLSYRRSDDPAATRLLQDRLTAVFGEQAIFYDVESIPQGEDFVTFIDRTIRACTAVLVVIGPRWLSASDPADPSRRRLDQPNDPVRIEIETALRLRKTTIPILINDTPMPAEDALPVTIALLHRQNAGALHTNQYFKPDMDRLIKTLQDLGVRPLPGEAITSSAVRPIITRRTVLGFLSIPLIVFLVGALLIGGSIYFVATQLPGFLSFPGSASTTSLKLDPALGQLACSDKQYDLTLTSADPRKYTFHVTVSNDPQGQPWASVKGGADGALAANGTQTISLIPSGALCNDLGGAPTSVTVSVTCTPEGGTPITPALKSTLTVMPALPTR